jgi:hypothetical protein
MHRQRIRCQQHRPPTPPLPRPRRCLRFARHAASSEEGAAHVR